MDKNTRTHTHTHDILYIRKKKKRTRPVDEDAKENEMSVISFVIYTRSNFVVELVGVRSVVVEWMVLDD